MVHPLRLHTSTYMASVGAPIYVNHICHEQDRSLHDHEFIEVVLIEHGTGRHCTLHGEDDLAPGVVLILHPGQWHYYLRCQDLALFNVCFAPSLLAHELAWAQADPLIGPLLPCRHPGQEVRCLQPPPTDFASALAAAQRLHDLDVPHHPLERRVEAIGLLTQILGAVAAGRVSGGRRAGHQPLAGVLAAIERELTRAWSLAGLATLAGLTPAHFCRRFRALTGHPPLVWIHRRRAENAAILLATTDQPVAAIGARIGWADANYFARRFRAVFGQSPTAYRQRMRERTTVAGPESLPAPGGLHARTDPNSLALPQAERGSDIPRRRHHGHHLPGDPAPTGGDRGHSRQDP